MIGDVTSSPVVPQVLPSGTPAGGAMGKNEFLKLFIAQMRNQDPMSPMNGEQFASQLAQFSSLEQLTNISSQLDGQAQVNQAIAGSIGLANATALIGRTVTASGNNVLVAGGKGNVTADVGAVGTGTLHVFDASGHEVGTRDVGLLTPGRHTVALGDAASGLADGAYTYKLTVTDPSGAAVPVNQYVTARIDGMRLDPSGPMLLAGGFDIPLANVRSIANSSN